MSTVAPVRSTGSRHRSQRGLATLDILLGMAIFALVIVIGVQNFNTFRERAYVTQASSDVKQAATAIEAVRTADEKYPVTVAADASSLTGVNLTRGSRIAGYTVTGDNFRACVMSGPKTTSSVAYAIYDSVKGSVTEAGKGTTSASCNGTGVDATPVDPSSPRVENVIAATVPGLKDVTITWDPVPGGGAYQVYLDGASTPAWSGPGTTATLPDMTDGDHTVTVTATFDSAPTDPSEPGFFTIYGDNDFYRFAHPVGSVSAGSWTSNDYTNLGTQETGEPYPERNGRWWKFTVPSSGVYTFSTVAPSSGPTGPINPLLEYWLASTDVIADAGSRIDYANGSFNRALTAGQIIRVRVATDGTGGQFRFRVVAGPENDDYGNTATVGALTAGSWTSSDYTNLGTQETGEPAPNRNGLWWKFTAPTVGLYTFSTVAPSSGTTGPVNPLLEYWLASSDALADAGTRVSYANGTFNRALTAGQTIRVRVATANNGGQFRFRVVAGPENDDYADAADVGALSSGSWTSADYVQMGTQQTNEPAPNRNGLWWKFVAPKSGTANFAVIAPTSGTAYANPLIEMWKATSPDLTQSGARVGYANGNYNFAVISGETYRVRVDTGSGTAARFRVKVTLP